MVQLFREFFNYFWLLCLCRQEWVVVVEGGIIELTVKALALATCGNLNVISDALTSIQMWPVRVITLLRVWQKITTSCKISDLMKLNSSSPRQNWDRCHVLGAEAWMSPYSRHWSPPDYISVLNMFLRHFCHDGRLTQRKLRLKIHLRISLLKLL